MQLQARPGWGVGGEGWWRSGLLPLPSALWRGLCPCAGLTWWSARHGIAVAHSALVVETPLAEWHPPCHVPPAFLGYPGDPLGLVVHLGRAATTTAGCRLQKVLLHCVSHGPILRRTATHAAHHRLVKLPVNCAREQCMGRT